MTEDDTYRVLKRTPFENIQKYLDLIPQTAPIYNINGKIFEPRKHDLVRYYEKIRCLEKHGWTLEEYVLESEKRVIMSAIDQYNKENGFPQELVERAKEFFPNARFTQAKMELE